MESKGKRGVEIQRRKPDTLKLKYSGMGIVELVPPAESGKVERGRLVIAATHA